jgi:hypothetical protein
MPHIGGQPSWHGEIVAVSDGADRKTKNNLASATLASADIVFLGPELFGMPRSALVRLGSGGFDHFQYSLLIICCLLITLPLEFVLGARVVAPGGQLGLCDHSINDHLSAWISSGFCLITGVTAPV